MSATINNPISSIISSIVLLVFILTLVVVLFGGKPQMILKPAFGIIGSLLGQLASIILGMAGKAVMGARIRWRDGGDESQQTKTPPRW